MAMRAFTRGAPRQITVSTRAALLAAVSNGVAGDVITLDTVVDPFTWTPRTRSPGAPGITVVMPAAQRYAIVADQPRLDLTILGGRVNGLAADSPQDYGIVFSAGASHLAVRGFVLEDCSNGITNQTGGGFDFEVTDFFIQFMRSDVVSIKFCQRLLIDDWSGQNLTVAESIFLWFTDGRAPKFNVPEETGVGVGGEVDSSHPDAIQISTGCTDLRVSGANVAIIGAGIVNFGGVGTTGETDGLTTMRAEYINNTIYASDAQNCFRVYDFQDVRIEGNVAGWHPVVAARGFLTPNFTVLRQAGVTTPNEAPHIGARVTVSGNSTVPVDMLTSTDTDLNIRSATPTGDTDVVAPALPNLRTLFSTPWAPAVVRPADLAAPEPPEVIRPTVLYSSPATPVVGTYITARTRGQRAESAAQWELRWVVDDVVVPDSETLSTDSAAGLVYRAVASGDVIKAQTRFRNSPTGAWTAWTDSTTAKTVA